MEAVMADLKPWEMYGAGPDRNQSKPWEMYGTKSEPVSTPEPNPAPEQAQKESSMWPVAGAAIAAAPMGPIASVAAAFAAANPEVNDWLIRQAKGNVAVYQKALAGLIGKTDQSPEVMQYKKDIDAGGVGAFAGEVGKYAPAMAASGIVAPALISGAIGAATDTSGNRGTAGATEAALSAVGGVIGKGLHAFTKGASLDKAREALYKIIGENNVPDALSALLRSKGDDLTTAQILQGVGPDNVVGQRAAGMEQLVRSKQGVSRSADPLESEAYWRDIAARQEAVRIGEMARMAGGETAETRLATETAHRRAIENSMGPTRRVVLDQANVGQDINRLTAEAAALRQQAQSAKTMVEYAQLNARAKALDQQAAAHSGLGYSPIDTSAITGRVQSILDDPKLGTSVNVQNVLGQVDNIVDEWVRKGGGTIDANALYGIRKTGVNEVVDRLLAGSNPAVSKKIAAQLSGELRPLIDDAIERAGGRGWKDYIEKYGARLEDVDRQRLLGEAMDLYKQGDSKPFLDLVKGESPKVVQDFLAGKRTLADALPDFQMQSLQKIAAEKTRDQTIKNVPPETVTAIMEQLNVPGFRVNLLNRWVTLANSAMERGAMKMEKGVYREMEAAMRDPKKMMALLERLPPTERAQAFGVLLGASTGGVVTE
jgi:hypothetical protein